MNLGWVEHTLVHNTFFYVFWIAPLSPTHTFTTAAIADLEGNTLMMVTWPFSDLCIGFSSGNASGVFFVPQNHCFDFFRNVSYLWKL